MLEQWTREKTFFLPFEWNCGELVAWRVQKGLFFEIFSVFSRYCLEVIKTVVPAIRAMSSELAHPNLRELHDLDRDIACSVSACKLTERSSSAVLAGKQGSPFLTKSYQLYFSTGEWFLYIFMGFSRQWKNSRQGTTWPMCMISLSLWTLTSASFPLVLLVPLDKLCLPHHSVFHFPTYLHSLPPLPTPLSHLFVCSVLPHSLLHHLKLTCHFSLWIIWRCWASLSSVAGS